MASIHYRLWPFTRLEYLFFFAMVWMLIYVLSLVFLHADSSLSSGNYTDRNTRTIVDAIIRLSRLHSAVFILNDLYWISQWPRFNRVNFRNGILLGTSWANLLLGVIIFGLFGTVPKSTRTYDSNIASQSFKRTLGMCIVQLVSSLAVALTQTAAVVHWTWFLLKDMKDPNHFIPVMSKKRKSNCNDDGIDLNEDSNQALPLAALFEEQRKVRVEMSLTNPKVSVRNVMRSLQG